MSVRARARTIPAPPTTIVAATDLGNVEVAKHGNLYLLTDPRGDVRIDGRGLGLYELDTRVLSTSTLRLNGVPLTLLRGPYLRDGLDTIQLTNPELRRNPEDKHAPGVASAQSGAVRDPDPPAPRRAARAGDDRQLLADDRGPRAPARARRGHGRHLRGPRVCQGRARAAPPDRAGRRAGGLRLRRARRRDADHDGARRGSDRRSDRRSGDLAGRERARDVACPARAERPGDGRLDGDDGQAAGRGGRTRRVDAGRCASAGARHGPSDRRDVRGGGPDRPAVLARPAGTRGSPAGRAADRLGPRVPRPDAPALAARPAPAPERRARPRASAYLAAGHPLVRDAVRPRQHHRRARGWSPFIPGHRGRDARRSSPASRRPPTTRGATRSRARSCTSCGPARWPARARRRTTPTTAASTRRRCG